MMITTGLIITAAGSGTRFGNNTCKCLTLLSGKPLILHSIDTLKSFQFENIIITVPEKIKKQFEEVVLPKYPDIQLITGGETRKESVEKAVKKLINCDMLMIHDAARPLLSKKLVQDLFSVDQDKKAVIPGIPVTDTIKITKNNHVISTPERATLKTIQTPQRFHTKRLLKAYKSPVDIEITDEAMLLEKLGEPIYIINGDPKNIKITYPKDIQIANTLLNDH